jgi:hypothetical protein
MLEEGEGAMNTKHYLTVAAIVAILYALAFLLIPVHASLFFSDFAEPRAVLYLSFSIWKISTPTSEISTRPICPTNIKFKHDGADARISLG